MNHPKLSIKPGVAVSGNETRFCFYCPEAASVKCEVFDNYSDKKGHSHDMEKDSSGYWHLTVHGDLSGKWYGYRVKHKHHLDERNPFPGELFADPYSKHVTVHNNYRQDAKSYIFRDDFDWGDDQHQFPDDPRDLIIYETHLKDLTAHPSSGADGDGFYQKFIDPTQKGGIEHLKRLGVNCVEFLPLHKFPPIEPPYGEKTDEGFFNTWNPYASNYWGYMTSFFFAPETSFASDHEEKISGITTASVSEFKQVVKQLHEAGITVLMDVVYNHTSLFDLNPCTHLCPHTYIRHNEKGDWLNRSGTGNEFASETPAGRQLIVDSLKYWVQEYHVDGFRFDLAALLDKDTWDVIREEMNKIDPQIVLIAEPWGGHYFPAQFSDHGWPSWNDKIRNSIKGSDPMHDRGFIFAEWQNETGRRRLENLMKGTLKGHEGGLYNTSGHAVNYLESHDGYTLGDFIRIGLRPELFDQKVKNRKSLVPLNDAEIDLAKLAALTLFTAQGITMIHAGQEFARTKVIAGADVDDPEIGKIDHNSYQKDNETNWINFDDIAPNRDLFEYYRGLIAIRKESPALRKAGPENIHFDHFDHPLVLAFTIGDDSCDDIYDYFVVLNAQKSDTAHIKLPPGSWENLVNKQIASSQAIDILNGNIEIPPKSGMLFRKFRL